MECIDNMLLPTSTVRIPIFERKGPTVLPHDLGGRDMKCEFLLAPLGLKLILKKF